LSYWRVTPIPLVEAGIGLGLGDPVLDLGVTYLRLSVLQALDVV